MSTEKRSRRGLHSFLEHIELGVDPVPGMERIFLLGVDQYGTVYLLHSLFSVPVDLYSKTRRLFACQGDMPGETPPQWWNFLQRPSRCAGPCELFLGKITPVTWGESTCPTSRQ